MLRLLTLFLELVNRMLTAWDEAKLKKEGRQEAIEEVADAADRNVEKAEAAVSTPDPERDERLRSRFDRSKNGQ